MRIVRIGAMFNRKDRKGIFDICRAKGYRDFILTDPANPFIPGTDVPRLRPIHLGGNRLASAKTRSTASSRVCRPGTRPGPLNVPLPARRPRYPATSRRPTSARRPMSECLAQTPPPKSVCRARGDPAASVDNRTVGKNTAGVPQPSQKDRDDRPEQREIPMALLSHISADVDRSYPFRFIRVDVASAFRNSAAKTRAGSFPPV